jgi:hypothetical protein
MFAGIPAALSTEQAKRVRLVGPGRPGMKDESLTPEFASATHVPTG